MCFPGVSYAKTGVRQTTLQHSRFMVLLQAEGITNGNPTGLWSIQAPNPAARYGGWAA